MATETDTTMTISTPDGQESEPFTMEDLDDARDRLRDEARDGQLFEARSQLSFDIGAGLKNAPDFATLKVTGDIGLVADLKRRQNIKVTISDDRTGEVIATRPATVTGIHFKDKTDQHGITTTERIHTATID